MKILLMVLIASELIVISQCTDEGTFRRYRRQFYGHNTDPSTNGGNQDVVMSCDIKTGGIIHHNDALVLNLELQNNSDELLSRMLSQQSKMRSKIATMEKLQNKIEQDQGRIESLFERMSTENSQLLSLVKHMELNYKHNSGAERKNMEDVDVIREEMYTSDPYIIEYAEDVDDDMFDIPENILTRVFGEPEILDEENHNSTQVDDQLSENTCSCNEYQYCSIEGGSSLCYNCTTKCPKGFEITTECGRSTDTVCGDVDECFGLHQPCPDVNTLCVNTAGGYLCLGSDAYCADGYFFNGRKSQCERCSDCLPTTTMIVPCTNFKDITCSAESHHILSDTWGGNLMNRNINTGTNLHQGLALAFQDFASKNNSAVESSIITVENNYGGVGLSNVGVVPVALLPRLGEPIIAIEEHGILWMEFNFAVRHTCRSYVQITALTTISSNTLEHGTGEPPFDDAVLGYGNNDYLTGDTSSRILSATRIAYSKGDRYKSVNLALVAEVVPTQNIQIKIHSPHDHCTVGRGKRKKDNVIKALPNKQKSGMASALWMSHDTGAVAFRATTSRSSPYNTLYASFVQEYASDLSVISLRSNGRYVEFNEDGIALIKYQQALYTVGENCIQHGVTVCANIIESGESESAETLVRTHKAGVSYLDTAVSLTAIINVKKGDLISFDVQVTRDCQVRYFNDMKLGALNILWVPRGKAESLIARADHRQAMDGSSRSKAVEFVVTECSNKGVMDIKSNSYVVFKKTGRVVINFSTKTKHSCDYLKTTIMYVKTEGGRPEAIINQVVGDTSGNWDGLALGGAYTVESGSLCYVTMSCIRGRINEMGFGEWSTLSLMWVPT